MLSETTERKIILTKSSLRVLNKIRGARILCGFTHFKHQHTQQVAGTVPCCLCYWQCQNCVDIGIHCTLLGSAVGYSHSHSHSHSQSPRVFVRVETVFCILAASYLSQLVERRNICCASDRS